MARTVGKHCPFSPAEIRACRKLLGWPQWRLAKEIRALTGGKTIVQSIYHWERGIERPGKAVSLALVELFRPVWYGDTSRLDIEALWASNEVSARLAKEAKKTTRKKFRKKWTTPLTTPDDSVHSHIPQWRPGRTKPKDA